MSFFLIFFRNSFVFLKEEYYLCSRF